MTDRRYHVVARSIPIVYTAEGDHDPNGMAFLPKAIDTLLLWARARWYDADQLLPRLHVRRQRAQLVIDGLARLDSMLARLRHGPNEDQELLAELIRREELSDFPESDDRLSHGPRRSSHRAFAVRDNVQRTLDDLRIALTDLGDLEGPPCWRTAVGPQAGLEEDDAAEPDGVVPDGEIREEEAPAAEAPELDPVTAPRPIRLVTLTPRQRQAWRRHWQAQAKL
ncbi:MAG: uncharacterized protein JWL91_2082, partial [Sphingomonas bacterium]